MIRPSMKATLPCIASALASTSASADTVQPAAAVSDAGKLTKDTRSPQHLHAVDGGDVVSTGGAIVVVVPSKLTRTPNNAALALLAPTAGHVLREGVSVSGDGGRAEYGTSTSHCPQNGGAGDNGSCIGLIGPNGAAGAYVGSAQIDWASVNFVASPALFEAVQAATDDTVAWRAAAATGKHFRAPAIGRNWVLSGDVTFSTPGQIVEGDGRLPSQVTVSSNAGFSKGVLTLTASNIHVHDLSVLFAQGFTATPSSKSSYTTYVPMVYAQNQPGTRIEGAGCFAAWDCFDLRGNDGTARVENNQMSFFDLGVNIDGSLDWIWLDRNEMWPFALTPNQLLYFYNGAGDGTGPLGIQSGRVDGLHVSHMLLSMFRGIVLINGQYCATAGRCASTSQVGTTGGFLDGLGIDTGIGIDMQAGDVQASGLSLYTGVLGTVFTQEGGRLQVSSLKIQQGNNTYSAPSLPAGSPSNATSHPLMSVTGGVLNLSGVDSEMGAVDQTILANNGGAVTVVGSTTHKNPYINYAYPVFNELSGSLVFAANYLNYTGGGTTLTFLNVAADTVQTVVQGNTALGAAFKLAGAAMPNSVPSPTSGYYQGNNGPPTTGVSQTAVTANFNYPAGYSQEVAANAARNQIVGALPACTAANAGKVYKMSKQDASTNNIVISTSGSDRINGTTAIFTNTRYGVLSATCSSTPGTWIAGY